MKNKQELLPREIVTQLDKYIIGQDQAKKAVAIALRNRVRRLKLPQELAEDITPKNIIMIGPTGVGKTEIARRLARLAGAPFVKVEASKFTEIGYVGRDVESMIRDLVRNSLQMVKEEQTKSVMKKAHAKAVDRVIDHLFPLPKLSADDTDNEHLARITARRENARKEILAGGMGDRKIIIEIAPQPKMPFLMDVMTDPSNMEDFASSLKDSLSDMMAPPQSKTRELTVSDALELFAQAEAENLLDMEKIKEAALDLAANSGIIFLDELDKIAGSDGGKGPDVSREGVQRDLLPIIEGSTVSTKQGVIRTDHILFIAAGAFHTSRPSDLIPELQGRFPIRVELNSLTEDDLTKILTQPRNSLTHQYIAMMETEHVSLTFSDDAIQAIAEQAHRANETVENIGARRLHTIMEKILEDILFKGPELSGTTVVVDQAYVMDAMGDILAKEDAGKYIL